MSGKKEDMKEIEIHIKGSHHIGKTTIATLIQDTLKKAGIENTTLVNSDGDASLVSAHQEESLKHLATQPLSVVIVDCNEFHQKMISTPLSVKHREHKDPSNGNHPTST